MSIRARRTIDWGYSLLRLVLILLLTATFTSACQLPQAQQPARTPFALMGAGGAGTGSLQPPDATLTAGSTTYLPSVGIEPTPAITATPTLTPTPSPIVLTFCDSFSAPRELLDYQILEDEITVSMAQPMRLVDLDVLINLSHGWIGDLHIQLEHLDTRTSAVLIDRPGKPASFSGCQGDDINAEFDDSAIFPAEDTCPRNAPALSGQLKPAQPLSAFDEMSIDGMWRLTVSDNSSPYTGALNEWCLIASLYPLGE